MPKTSKPTEPVIEQVVIKTPKTSKAKVLVTTIEELSSEPKKTTKTPKVTKTSIPTEVNEQVTDSVTQTKPSKKSPKKK